MARFDLLYKTGDLASSHASALLVSTAFPPSAEAGSARWEGFAPYLTSAGWKLDVVMEHPDTLPLLDYDRVKQLPAGVRVTGIPRTQPAWLRSLVKARQFLRRTGGPNSRPDRSAITAVDATAELQGGLRSRLILRAESQRDEQWIIQASAAANAIVTPDHRLIISSGPPHVAHAAAHRVSCRTGLPHVVDLRDPWVVDGDTEATAGFDVSTLYEHTTLHHAALVLANTEYMRDDLARRYPELAARIVDIPNGSDLAPQMPPLRKPGEPFIVAHAGALYLDRDPRPLLRAVARLRRAGMIQPATFQLVFMGGRPIIAGKGLEAWADEYGISDVFEVRERGSREAARSLLQSAAVAVAFQGQSTSQIPAKVYEYVSFPVWLLALVGTTSATARLLRDSRAVVLSMDDESGIEAALRAAFTTFQERGRPEPVGADGRFSRGVQAGRLLSLIAKLS